MSVLPCLCLISLCLISGCGTQGGDQKSDVEITAETPAVIAYAEMTESEWNRFEAGSSPYQEKEQLEEDVDRAIADIVEYTGYSDWTAKFSGSDTEVHIWLTDGACFADMGVMAGGTYVPCIHLNQDSVLYGIPPIYHEMTHLLFWCETGSVSLLEGFATFVQARLSDLPVPPNFGVDIHVMAKYYIDTGDGRALSAVGTVEESAQYFGNSTASDGPLYLESASFVDYLVENYGMDAFLQIYRSTKPESEYVLATGKTLDALKEDWLSFLADYPSSMTGDEITEAQERALASYGVPLE